MCVCVCMYIYIYIYMYVYIYIYIYIIYETIETATKGLLLFVTVFSKILTGTGSNAVENKMHPTLF